MADQVPNRTRSLFERLFDPTVQEQVAKRGRAIAAAVGDAAETASEQAAATWRDAEPMRREAARAGRDALRWGRRRWRSDLQPGIDRLWSNRAVALGAAGAAVPVAKEILDDAAVRLGIRRRREQRHWGAFFIGMLIGAAAGVVAAMLTAPKAGREMRDELAVRAREAAGDAAVKARETAKDAASKARETATDAASKARYVASRAREVAANAGEWVPIFQRPEASEPNGQPAVEEPEVSPEVAPPAVSRKRTPTSAPVEEPQTPD
jgi:gas vesicle protein